MNKEQCEYFAKYYKAKADGECVQFKDYQGVWFEWDGTGLKNLTTSGYIELRIKPEPLEYWMNMHPSLDKPIVYNSEDDAHTAAGLSKPISSYTYIAKRFVEDV